MATLEKIGILINSYKIFSKWHLVTLRFFIKTKKVVVDGFSLPFCSKKLGKAIQLVIANLDADQLQQVEPNAASWDSHAMELLVSYLVQPESERVHLSFQPCVSLVTTSAKQKSAINSDCQSSNRCTAHVIVKCHTGQSSEWNRRTAQYCVITLPSWRGSFYVHVISYKQEIFKMFTGITMSNFPKDSRCFHAQRSPASLQSFFTNISIAEWERTA